MNVLVFRWLVVLAALVASGSLTARAAEESDASEPVANKPAVGLQAVMTTVDDEQVAGRITQVKDGVVTVAAEQERSLPLDDVVRIGLGDSAVLDGGADDLVWVGQDNHDLVQVGSASGGNGIQDIHLHARNLRPAKITQVRVICRLPERWGAWRLDTANSPHWRVAIARVDKEPEADLYIEPPLADSFGREFEVTYSYEDGKVVQNKVTATTHTSDKLKVDRERRPGAVTPKDATNEASNPGPEAQVLLSEGRLRGKLTAMTGESLELELVGGESIEIPLLHVRGIWFGHPGPASAATEFKKSLADPTGEDVIYVVAPDESLTSLPAGVRGLTDERLKVSYQGVDREIERKRALAIVFAAHPPLPPLAPPSQVFSLASGDSLPGYWVGVDGDKLEIETAWKGRVKLPGSALNQVSIRGGRVTSLADLEPVAVEQVPYFGRVIPWGRDTGFEGAPPRLGDKAPLRSISMHSRCVLTYALDGQYDTFKATLGFDDSAAESGRVACRVLVDGREAFAEADLRADEGPREIEVPLAAARQMTLEVDFGQGEDVGDRILWAEPRLLRAASPQADIEEAE